MQYYVLDEDGLRSLVSFVKTCNPPEGMAKKEMLKNFQSLLISIKDESVFESYDRLLKNYKEVCASLELLTAQATYKSGF